jgi:hypothetical protein
VLNNAVIKDNRIPPYGFRYEEARVRNALPVPASQFGGGPVYHYWDEVDIGVMARAVGAASARIDLLYQPTSWEYIQFLAHANDGGNAFLADEGLNLLDAWLNAGDATTRMAAPHVMASTIWGTAPSTCEAIVPVLNSATAGSKQVALAWQALAQLPAEYTSYQFGLYYDQAGKAQAITDLPWDSGSYADTALTNGQEYCYKLTAKVTTADGCTAESTFSNILCATPSSAGQAVVGVTQPLQTGRWVRSGQGKNATTTFELTDSFAAGDAVVIQGVAGSGESTPSGAVVQVTISSGGFPVATLEPATTDSTGRFEVTWQTQKPNKKGQGGTPTGSYSAAVTDITLNNYSWDGQGGGVNFTL